MTEGQWLLEFFWNNRELLAAVNKWGGVAMAFIGACIVAPAAVKHKLEPIGRAALAVKTWVLKVTRRSKPVHKSVHVGDLLLSGEGTLTSVLEAPWKDDVPNEEKIAWLHKQLLHVKNDVELKTKRLNEADNELREQISELEQRTSPEIEKLQTKLAEQEALAVQIDSAGLPPIVAGIILTGVPDELSHIGAFGWVIWGLAVWVTWRAMRHSKRSGVWNRTP